MAGPAPGATPHDRTPLPVLASVSARFEMVGGVQKLKTKLHLCPAEADNTTAKSRGVEPFSGMRCNGWKDNAYEFEFSNGDTITPELAAYWLTYCLSNMPATSEVLTAAAVSRVGREGSRMGRGWVAGCRGGVAVVSRLSRWCHFLSNRRRLPRNWPDGGVASLAAQRRF